MSTRRRVLLPGTGLARGRRGRGDCGYTLVELVLVVVIISAFVAVVVPRFSDFVPSLRVDRAAEELFATGRKAHADAALNGLRYRLNIDKEENEYYITVQDKPFVDPEEWNPVRGSEAERYSLPEGVTIECDQTEYEFLPDGTATGGTLTLSNDKGYSVTIKIVSTTGRVIIEDPDEEE
ncbi:MAG: prepilin-type N-terminal cleavage/methylation domain-containing protein [Planctomycetota bacterium]|jgi:prepilin-type N-terminal cleavage/methylation domain-containing protein